MDDNPYSPPQHEGKPPSPACRAGLASIALGSAATGLFVAVGSHARIVSIHRLDKEVRWEGPLAKWAIFMEILGWILVAVAALLASGTVRKDDYGKTTFSAWGIFGLTLVLFNLLGHCLFFAALAES